MKLKEKLALWWHGLQPLIAEIKALIASDRGEAEMSQFDSICEKVGKAIVAESDVMVGKLKVHVKSVFSDQTTLDKAIQNIILRKVADKG